MRRQCDLCVGRGTNLHFLREAARWRCCHSFASLSSVDFCLFERRLLLYNVKGRCGLSSSLRLELEVCLQSFTFPASLCNHYTGKSEQIGAHFVNSLAKKINIDTLEEHSSWTQVRGDSAPGSLVGTAPGSALLLLQTLKESQACWGWQGLLCYKDVCVCPLPWSE